MVNEIQAYVKTWENRCYNTGIPDECPVEIDDMVPSYKKIAIAILKNDLRGLGFEPKQSKYYSILKRIEIQARATDPQLKLL